MKQLFDASGGNILNLENGCVGGQGGSFGASPFCQKSLEKKSFGWHMNKFLSDLTKHEPT